VWLLAAGTVLALVGAAIAFWASVARPVSSSEIIGVIVVTALVALFAGWRKRRKIRSATQRLKDSALW
jgi:hypothetical protein